MSDSASESSAAERTRRAIQDPLTLIEFWVRDIYRPLAAPGTPPSFFRDGIRLPGPGDFAGHVAVQQLSDELRHLFGEARVERMTEAAVWEAFDAYYRELLRGSFTDLCLELNGFLDGPSDREARRLIAVTGRLEELIAGSLTAYHPDVPHVWDDLRAGVTGLRQTRLFPPRAEQSSPVDSLGEKKDGPEGGEWCWVDGKRRDVPKGVLYRLLELMWRQDSAPYDTVFKVVFDGPQEAKRVRQVTSDLNKALRRIGVPWQLRANSDPLQAEGGHVTKHIP